MTIDFFNKNIKPINRVIGFNGSPRINGNSGILLKTILSGVNEHRIPVESWNLSEIQFKGCLGCEKCRKDKVCTGIIDGMTAMYQRIYSSKGLVLISPTHNYNITSWMKAFIDRLYCFYNFEYPRPGLWSSSLNGQNRKAVIVGICEQKNEKDLGFTISAMKEPLKALGYDIITELAVTKTFKMGEVKNNEEILNKSFNIGKKLAIELSS